MSNLSIVTRAHAPRQVYGGTEEGEGESGENGDGFATCCVEWKVNPNQDGEYGQYDADDSAVSIGCQGDDPQACCSSGLFRDCSGDDPSPDCSGGLAKFYQDWRAHELCPRDGESWANPHNSEPGGMPGDCPPACTGCATPVCEVSYGAWARATIDGFRRAALQTF